MSEHRRNLDDQYMTWLYEQFAHVHENNPSRSYWSITAQLYAKPFTWMVPNDDNRAEDGVELRDEFIEQYRVEYVPADWRHKDCSFLEMLIGLARRTAYNSLGSPAEWVCKFLENMGIWFSDAEYDDRAARMVDLAMRRVNQRLYEWDGQGGLFPLMHPHQDQREVELWYQASAYLLEGGYLDHAP